MGCRAVPGGRTDRVGDYSDKHNVGGRRGEDRAAFLVVAVLAGFGLGGIGQQALGMLYVGAGIVVFTDAEPSMEATPGPPQGLGLLDPEITIKV